MFELLDKSAQVGCSLVKTYFSLICFYYSFFFVVGQCFERSELFSRKCSTTINGRDYIRYEIGKRCEDLVVHQENLFLAHKLNKSSFFLDWNSQTVEEIDRLYRALNEIVGF